MAGRRPRKPKPTVLLQMPKVADEKVQKALDPVYQAILDLQKRAADDT